MRDNDEQEDPDGATARVSECVGWFKVKVLRDFLERSWAANISELDDKKYDDKHDHHLVLEVQPLWHNKEALATFSACI